MILVALLISSAILFSLSASASSVDGGSSGDGGSKGASKIAFDSASKTMSLSTGLSVGSTAPNRIRSIGWFVTITLPDGQTASSVFETNGSNGSSNGYSWSYDYVVDEFAHDAGQSGQTVAEDFFNSTGGTISMSAYFVWWKAGSSSNSLFNFNGPADGEPGAVSGYFSDSNANYGPNNVSFTQNPDSRFDGAPGIDGVATTYAQAAAIEAEWGGDASSLQDYYPAIGVLDGTDGGGSSNIGGEILDRVYRVNTDVITPVVVNNNSSSDDLGSTVTFTVDGVTQQSKTVPIPPNGSNLCWFKWHTPSTPGYVNISASVSGEGSAVVNCGDNYIYPCDELTPPDPKGTDTKPSSFQMVEPGNQGETNSLSWGVWNYYITWDYYTTWSEVTDSTGQPILDPVTGLPEETPTEVPYQVVNWYYTSYSASLVSSLKITPDTHCPTAFLGGDGVWNMKSGYGIQEQVQVQTTVYTNSPSDVTGVQRVAGFYPEFQYGSYDRLLENMANGLFQLFPNKYSMYNSPIHFLPVWYPNEDYLAQSFSFDAWTPAGELTSYATDTIHINGSCYDDWHILPGY
jgi:hypothetical protein